MGVNTINWDDSPKGTERLAVETGHSWLRLKNDIIFEWKGGVWCVLNKSNATHIWNNAIQKPTLELDSKPVFTQEMADRGEIPPIGSKCIAVWQSCGDKCESEVIIAHINGNQVACIDSDNNYLIQYVAEDEYFKPLDNRTPKQKTVDAACESIGYVDNPIITSVVSDLYDNGFIKTDGGE